MTAITLTAAAVAVMKASEAMEKVRLTHLYAAAWGSGEIAEIGSAQPPARPARPARPELHPAGAMPRRSGGEKGRIALIHAICHIELNAIDLGWDIIARFTSDDLPRAFYDDWVQVADDEATHFELLAARLAELGAQYGDLPAHDGLWEAAVDTSGDLLARLALVPMLLEARGLDTTPGAVTKLEANNDLETARIMARIGLEEIPHVRAGVRWFEHICARRGLEPVAHWQGLVADLFKGKLKGPFAHDARSQAGMARAYYDPPNA